MGAVRRGDGVADGPRDVAMLRLASWLRFCPLRGAGSRLRWKLAAPLRLRRDAPRDRRRDSPFISTWPSATASIAASRRGRAARRDARVRQHSARRRYDAPRLERSRARAARCRTALRRAHPAAGPRTQRHRGSARRARHRRQHDRLFDGPQVLTSPASGCRLPSGSSRSATPIPTAYDPEPYSSYPNYRDFARTPDRPRADGVEQTSDLTVGIDAATTP